METETWARIFQNKIKTLQKKGTWCLEFDDDIKPKRSFYGWKEYIGRIIARFKCTFCDRRWLSNRVMVVFHMQLRNGQGTVKIRLLLQNCKVCTDAPMVKPSVENNHIQILMDNLMEKIREKFYDENLGPRKRYLGYRDVNSPHEPTHCEGCKLGVCRRQ